MRTVYRVQTRFVATRQRRQAPWPVMAAFLLFALVIFVAGVGAVFQQRALDSRGLTTHGTVVGRYHSSGKGSRTELTYQFEANGMVYQGKCGVTYPFYQQVYVGASIPVTYLADSPKASRCLESTEYRQAYMMMVSSTLLGALMVFCLLPGRRVRVAGNRLSA